MQRNWKVSQPQLQMRCRINKIITNTQGLSLLLFTFDIIISCTFSRTRTKSISLTVLHAPVLTVSHAQTISLAIRVYLPFEIAPICVPAITHTLRGPTKLVHCAHRIADHASIPLSAPAALRPTPTPLIYANVIIDSTPTPKITRIAYRARMDARTALPSSTVHSAF